MGWRFLFNLRRKPGCLARNKEGVDVCVENYDTLVNAGPMPLKYSVPDFYGMQLCMVMHCCAIGAMGDPVNAK